MSDLGPFLDEVRSRLSLSQVVGRKVTWDMRKSNQAKGDFWAPCPFHQEKSASFHVDDRKGFYYCFGCHAKGDIISFVRETENVEFIEALKILAAEAGVKLPERDPRAQERNDKRTQLADVMEMAVQHYRLSLKTAAAREAREYLTRRGLSEAAQDRFEIGYAPDLRQGLFTHLTGKGISPEHIIEAGLCAKPDDGGAPFDRFRGRIIFPIRDGRGRCIGLGGRSMDPNARAKYLNSPETPLFDKGRNLYNIGPAREAAGKGKPFIVAEGYMDVIALSEAGFTGAVAPLGTAVTEDQLRLMWRIAPEPIIALDGDKAGIRAAHRVIDLALPLLQAGQSLRFAIMPDGQDPDDLIRAQGAGAVQKVLDAAVPMVDLLWSRETEGKVFDSPERRAALDKVLRDKIKVIADPSVRAHYGEAIKNLRWELFNPRKPRRGKAFEPKAQTLSTTKSSLLVGADQLVEDQLRQCVILAALVATPDVLPEFEEQVHRLEFVDPEFAALHSAVLAHSGPADQLADHLGDTVGQAALEKLMGHSHIRITPPVRNPNNAEIARLTIAEELAKLSARKGLSAEIDEAAQDLEGLADEAVTWRLSQAAAAHNSATRSQQADKAEYDFGENGARIDREERKAFDVLLQQISYSKRRK